MVAQRPRRPSSGSGFKFSATIRAYSSTLRPLQYICRIRRGLIDGQTFQPGLLQVQCSYIQEFSNYVGTADHLQFPSVAM